MVSVAVLKQGKLAEGQEQVDAISGATITSTGVSTMLNEELVNNYKEFLSELPAVEEETAEEENVESIEEEEE